MVIIAVLWGNSAVSNLHSHSVVVVIYHLLHSLPDFLCEVKLTVGEISRDLTELVHTFR